MFDRLQKPFLTVETGEGCQPNRTTWHVKQKEPLINALEKLQCIRKNTSANSWDLFWTAECDALHFESMDAFRKNPENPVRLGSFSLRDDRFYFNTSSFKRACLVLPFIHDAVIKDSAHLFCTDFINKVFAIDERLPHGFAELFKDEELDRILSQRISDYHQVKEQCEHASTADEAFTVLAEYAKKEAQKRLPYAERYYFKTEEQTDPEVIFLAFYIFLRSRELVAIKRWYGETGYTLADANEDTIEKVFGEMGLDIID